MGTPIIQVDAFTDTPFRGNPAAVCLMDQIHSGDWMQSVASEMNQSETAFLVRNGSAFDLRWFTPSTEVDLCGHATLASAHVLWEEGRLPLDQPARFNTRSGPLTATKEGSWIQMDFPATPASATASVAALELALGARAQYTGQSRFDYLLELSSEEEVRSLQPDFTALRRLPARGTIVTSRASGAGYDFVSRFFAPAAGVNEDPVTGSAHCCLAPFWSERLGLDNLTGYQASARGGYVRMKCAGSRVLLSGQAVTVLRAELL
jgi:PhzF family phenazine biosynthesis protein